jgi:hypothetical protein
VGELIVGVDESALKDLPPNVATIVASAKTPAMILKENESALALILSADKSVSLGSGFFIGDGSAVVTNLHVIQGARRVVVKTGNGQILLSDSVYAFDEKNDLAILKLDSSEARAVKLGDSEKVAVGSSIVVIGNPEGFKKSVTNGLVSGVRTLDGQQLFQISAPISHGSSGGPVFDDKGQVVGVVVAFLSDGQNLNFAIPINLVSEMWAKRKETALASLPANHSYMPPASAPELEGGWAATFADSLSSGQLSFTLAQDGTSVRGTYTTSMGGGGTITGQVTNNKFSFQLTQSIKDCPGAFTGSADLRSNSMIGTYTGTDCQGAHTSGTFSMTKGVAPIQAAPTVPTTASVAPAKPIIEYGSPNELRGVRKIFIYGVDPDIRNNMLKQFAKHPELQVVGEIGAADIVLAFGAATFSMGAFTNVWSDGYGHTYGNTVPRYGITGEGSAMKFVPPNTLRVVWQFSATRTSAFQRRPSTNFVRDFVSAWEKVNK